MDSTTKFPWQQEAVIRHNQRLLRSYQYWTGNSLVNIEGPEKQAQALFEAPFVLISHGIEEDPILNYGNRLALWLWQMDWDRFMCTPSRYTAEPIEQEERARLLAQVKSQGFISNHQGIRISSNGQRFQIKNVMIWDVLNEENTRCAQAATFTEWHFINSDTRVSLHLS
jgi:hypothetical protein